MELMILQERRKIKAGSGHPHQFVFGTEAKENTDIDIYGVLFAFCSLIFQYGNHMGSILSLGVIKMLSTSSAETTEHTMLVCVCVCHPHAGR